MEFDTIIIRGSSDRIKDDIPYKSKEYLTFIIPLCKNIRGIIELTEFKRSDLRKKLGKYLVSELLCKEKLITSWSFFSHDEGKDVSLCEYINSCRLDTDLIIKEIDRVVSNYFSGINRTYETLNYYKVGKIITPIALFM